MLFDLAVSWLTWIGSRPDGLDFIINVFIDLDLVALLAVPNVQEHVLVTRVLAYHGACFVTAFAWTYGFRCSRLPLSYLVGPCR